MGDGERNRRPEERTPERERERRDQPPEEGWPAEPDQPTLDNESAGEEATETPGMGA